MKRLLLVVVAGLLALPAAAADPTKKPAPSAASADATRPAPPAAASSSDDDDDDAADANADPRVGGDDATLAPTPEPGTFAPPPLPPPPDLHDLPPPTSSLGDLLAPLLKTMLMLVVVVALAYLTLNKGLGKLLERQNLGKRVKVVERVSLDPKRSLFLVDIDGKQMLLGAGEGGVVFIKDVEPKSAQHTSAASQQGAPATSFMDMLRKKAGQTDAPPTTTGISSVSGSPSADEKASA